MNLHQSTVAGHRRPERRQAFVVLRKVADGEWQLVGELQRRPRLPAAFPDGLGAPGSCGQACPVAGLADLVPVPVGGLAQDDVAVPGRRLVR